MWDSMEKWREENRKCFDQQMKFKKKRRHEVWNKGEGRCAYCNSELDYKTFHVDHIFPISRGGTNALNNLNPSCPICNVGKGSKTISEWADWKERKIELSFLPPPVGFSDDLMIIEHNKTVKRLQQYL